MSIEAIGKRIVALRKARGAKQDELARHVGVSAQAVSKWENGGVPDTELLPKIADFFGVSIDSLFDRELKDGRYIQRLLMESLSAAPEEEKFSLALDFCWDMERALVMGSPNTWGGSVADMQSNIGEGMQSRSTAMTDYGFTRMGIGTRSQYFLVVPEAKDKGTAYLDGINYTELFRDLSDETFFDALVMLNKREGQKVFTCQLLERSLGVTSEKAQEVLDTLLKYELVLATEVELDDEVQKVYTFLPTPSFVALLIFANEMIQPRCRHDFRLRGRKKPYLK